MVFYEIDDCNGPIDAAPRFSSVEAAIALARSYANDGRQGVCIYRVETIWTAEPEGDDNE